MSELPIVRESTEPGAISVEPPSGRETDPDDDAALDAMIMVVAGRMNVALVSALRGAGVNAVGLNGVSAHLVKCVKRPAKVVMSAERAARLDRDSVTGGQLTGAELVKAWREHAREDLGEF